MNFLFWVAVIVVVTVWVLMVFAAFSDIAIALRNIAYELRKTREDDIKPTQPWEIKYTGNDLGWRASQV